MMNEEATDLVWRSIELVNEGAALIESGNLRYASVVLRSALQVSKRCLVEVRNSNDAEMDTSSSPEGANFGIDQYMASTMEGVTADTDKDVGFSSASLSEQPIKITNFSMPSGEGTEGNAFVTMVCTVAVFNLALSSHLDALSYPMSCQDEKRTRMLQATKLYESIFKLQEGNMHLDSAFFLLTCLNNLGNLHQELEQQDRATACFNQLTSLLMFLIEQRSICDRPTFIHYEQYLACFFRSVSKVIFPNATIVASAA